MKYMESVLRENECDLLTLEMKFNEMKISINLVDNDLHLRLFASTMLNSVLFHK